MRPSKRVEPDPLPRCCERHDNWTTLTGHLATEFADLPAPFVVGQVCAAKRAVERVAVDAHDALRIGELIARQQLLIRAGRGGHEARLDPQLHAARGR